MDIKRMSPRRAQDQYKFLLFNKCCGSCSTNVDQCGICHVESSNRPLSMLNVVEQEIPELQHFVDRQMLINRTTKRVAGISAHIIRFVNLNFCQTFTLLQHGH